MSSDDDNADDKGSSPAGQEGTSAQPLAEEATLALLPDR